MSPKSYTSKDQLVSPKIQTAKNQLISQKPQLASHLPTQLVSPKIQSTKDTTPRSTLMSGQNLLSPVKKVLNKTKKERKKRKLAFIVEFELSKGEHVQCRVYEGQSLKSVQKKLKERYNLNEEQLAQVSKVVAAQL